MKKRLFAVLLAVLIVASLCAVTAFAEEPDTGDGSEQNPYTTPKAYKDAVEAGGNGHDNEDVWLVIDNETFHTNEFNLGNVQNRQNPPKLHLILTDCTFYGNSSADGVGNYSFMYLPNCVQLVIEDCHFYAVDPNKGEDQPKLVYGINWNLIQVTGANVSIKNSDFHGPFEKNAIKLNQRNGADDSAGDVKNGLGDNVIPASIEKAEITNCTFEGDGAIIAIGSQGKYTEAGLASPSTGLFPLTIERCTGTNSDGSVTVKLDYLAAENAEVPVETVSATKSYEQDEDTYADTLAKNGFVAMVGSAGFENLQEAINAAGDEGVVELIANETLNGNAEQTTGTYADYALLTIPEGKNITITTNNGSKLTLNYKAGEATDITKQAGAILLNTGSKLTLDGIDVNITGNTVNGARVGSGFRIGKDAVLTLDGANVTLDNLSRGVNEGAGTGNSVKVTNGSSLYITNISGNASNGGAWTVTDSTVYINGVGNHGLSVESLEADSATISIYDAGYTGIMSNGDVKLENGTAVAVVGCGGDLPHDSTSAPNGTRYENAMEIKSGNTLTVDDSELVLTGNANKEGIVIDNIYLVGSTLVTDGDYSLIAKIVKGEGETEIHYVRYVSEGVITGGQVVEDGKDYTIVSEVPTRSGYEFRGWRYDGKLYKAGDKITGITSDITLTAVWDAIDIPDTYPIEIADAANGEVSTSLTNASRGSVITVTVDPDEGYELGSLTVTGPDGRVDVKRVNATTYTFVMPDGEVTVRAAFVVEGLPFTDVSANQWFYEAVSYVYTNGMMEGDSATTFNPDGGMTRAMFWAVLARIDGETVTGSNWVELARAWAMESGTSDGTDPNGLVTREMMVTMLYRFAGSPAVTGSLSGYTDAASVSDWAEDAMVWAIDEGVISGVTAATLAPQGTATRAQCATILMRYAESVA